MSGKNGIKNLIAIDLDGVLAKKKSFVPIWDELRRVYNADMAKAKKALFDHNDEYIAGRISNEVFWDKICADLGIQSNYRILNQLFFSDREYNMELLQRLQPSRKEHPIYVVSNNYDLAADQISGELRTYVDRFFWSCHTHLIKPNAEIFPLLAENAGISLEQIVFIDDDPRNLSVLAGTGVKTIEFAWGKKPNEWLYQQLEEKGVVLQQSKRIF